MIWKRSPRRTIFWFDTRKKEGMFWVSSWKAHVRNLEMKSMRDLLNEWKRKGKRKYFLTLSWKTHVYEVTKFTIAIRYFHLNFQIVSIKLKLVLMLYFYYFINLFLMGGSLGWCHCCWQQWVILGAPYIFAHMVWLSGMLPLAIQNLELT